MPEGAISSSEVPALCHYAQSYRELSPLLSFVAPTAYRNDYGKPPIWVGEVVAGGTPVLGGIQVYSVPAQEIANGLFAARWNGAAGFVLFRHGVCTSADANWAAIVPSFDKVVAATQSAYEAGWMDNSGVTVTSFRHGSIDLVSGAKFVFFRDSVSLALAKKKGVRNPVTEFGPHGAFAVNLRNGVPGLSAGLRSRPAKASWGAASGRAIGCSISTWKTKSRASFRRCRRRRKTPRPQDMQPPGRAFVVQRQRETMGILWRVLQS